MHRVWLVLCGLLLTLFGAAHAHASTTSVESAAVFSATTPQVSAAAESSPVFDTDRSPDHRDSNSPEPTDSRDLVDEDLDDLDDDDGGDPGDPDSSPLSVYTLPGLLPPSCASTLWLAQGGCTLATTYLTDSVRRL